MPFTSLLPYGWSDRWVAPLAEHPDLSPARVVRHDGAALLLATVEGLVHLPLGPRLAPAPTVGDWVAHDGQTVRAVLLPRRSLLRRKASGADAEQALAANVDVVLLACGLDRPVRPGRIQRGATLAWDAGAVPVVVLTKASTRPPDAVLEAVELAAHAAPGLDVLVTSALEGEGLDELVALASGRTLVVVGESGAGKSSLVNALAGADAAATGRVRSGDHKGRHTTTARHLHLLAAGGCLIDTPGLREVGLWADADAVDAGFGDIEDLAPSCRFADCAHDREPGCAVNQAVAEGRLDAARVAAWHRLAREAAARELTLQERHRRDKRFGRMQREATRHKRR